MSRIITKKRLVLGAVTSLLAAAMALAYWTTTGDGTGSGDVKATNGTITLAGTIDNELAPGESSDVTITASNPGTTDLYVTSTTLSAIDAAAAGCVDGDFTVTDANVAQGVVVPNGAVDQVLPNTHEINFANDLVNSQDDCKDSAISFDLDSD